MMKKDVICLVIERARKYSFLLGAKRQSAIHWGVHFNAEKACYKAYARCLWFFLQFYKVDKKEQDECPVLVNYFSSSFACSALAITSHGSTFIVERSNK